MSRVSDALALLRSLQLIVEAGASLQRAELSRAWSHSSVRAALDALPAKLRERPPNLRDVGDAAADSTSRVSTVLAGVNEFMRYDRNQPRPVNDSHEYVRASEIFHTTPVGGSEVHATPSVEVEVEKPASLRTERTSDSYTSPSEDLNVSVKVARAPPPPLVRNIEATNPKTVPHVTTADSRRATDIKLSASDKALLRRLDRQHRERMGNNVSNDEHVLAFVEAHQLEEERIAAQRQQENAAAEQQQTVTVVPNPKSLTATAKQRKVPSSRVGRMVSFGQLAAGLGIGTLAEYTKRTLGIEKDNEGNIFMNKANMERIVDTLCKVRGAALKIGQILSIQDESIVDPELGKALERVRKSADFMPTWQLERVLRAELGDNWAVKFHAFEIQPFAAASIGQVHRAESLDGRTVAVKIQYPGVAQSIESDIDNLIGIMKVWNIFPPGMFVDNVVIVAKRELTWEVDYKREAQCTRKYKELVTRFPYYHVPDVVDSLCTQQVFTSELVEGIPVDQCVNLPLEERRFIAEKMLELVLREIMDFQYMQTDPNWANFLYNPSEKKIMLLDFGACRPYSKKFTDNYVRIIKAASDGDRGTILTYSRELGFFTGYESKVMEEAHIDAVMILGEVFRGPGDFDFSNQSTTERIQHLVPTMLAHRLCPPPEEIYSLHRKISGVFLLCSKLKASANGRRIFNALYDKYRFDH